MKKIILASIGLSALLFTGCGGGSNSSDSSKVQDTSNEQVVETPACTVNGDTVLVDEGKTCKSGKHTLTCKDNRVTMDSSMTSKTININGTTYTCQ